jgi:hypothetical protein
MKQALCSIFVIGHLSQPPLNVPFCFVRITSLATRILGIPTARILDAI